MAQENQNTNTSYVHSQPKSLMAKLITFGMKIAGLKNVLEKDLSMKVMNHKSADVPKSFYKKFDIDAQQIEGKTIWTISPKENISGKTILYLHGGAYVYGMQKIYWGFVKELVLKTNTTIIIPDYPLAPENKANEVYTFIEKVYDWVISKTKSTDLILLGDSAGGGLAFGFAQNLRNDNKQLPSQLILLSPWLDITMSNPNIKPIEEKDPELTVKGLQMSGKAYAGNWDGTDYRVSPINGQFHDLPTISVFVGTHEVFYADCQKLKQQLEVKDIKFNYYVYPELFHDWVIVSPKMKESQSVLNQLTNQISKTSE